MACCESRDIWHTDDTETGALEVRRGASDATPFPSVLRFRDFVVIPEARLLHQGGHPLDIGSRAFDLLVILARYRGQIVPKTTIISFVWPTTLVEESNLRFQMVLLRKVLGPARHLIKTIPGRGYLLAIDGPPTGGHVEARVGDTQDRPGRRLQESAERVTAFDERQPSMVLALSGTSTSGAQSDD